MAPPPPSGPPPSLPIDRAELKRGAARLYTGDSIAGGGEMDAKRLRSCTMEQLLASSGGGVGGLAGAEAAGGGDESYARAPASARWVWDHMLQQDNSAESVAVLEKRALQALGTLSVGLAPDPSGDHGGAEEEAPLAALAASAVASASSSATKSRGCCHEEEEEVEEEEKKDGGDD